MRTTTTIALAGMLCIASFARGQGFDNQYTVHTGDVSPGDGLVDIYVKKPTTVVFVDVGDIPTPIVTSGREVAEFYLQNLGNGHFALQTLSASQLSAVRQWPASNIDFEVRHINFDSAPDAQLEGVDEVIPGALDQMIFASQTRNGFPMAIRAIDDDLQRFAFDSFSWGLDVNYFRNNAPWRIVGTDPGGGSWQGSILDTTNNRFISLAIARCEAAIYGNLCIVSSRDPSPCVRSVDLLNSEGVKIGTETRDVCVADMHVWGFSPGAIVRARDYSVFHPAARAIADAIEQRSPGGIEDVLEQGMDEYNWEILNDILREILKDIYGPDSIEEEEEEGVTDFFALLCRELLQEENSFPHDPFPLDQIFPQDDETFHHYDVQTKACDAAEPNCTPNIIAQQVLRRFTYTSQGLKPTITTLSGVEQVMVYVPPPGFTRYPRLYQIPFGHVVQRVITSSDIGPQNGQWQIGAIQNITLPDHWVYPGTINRTVTLGTGTSPHFFTHGIGLNRAGTLTEQHWGEDVPSQGINMLMGCSNDVWGPAAFKALDKEAAKWWRNNIRNGPGSPPLAVGFGLPP